MELTFGVRNGRTIIRDSYCEVPFKITRPLTSPQSPVVHLIVMHCTAGIFGGDKLETSLRIQSGAQVRITQQAATRLHPSEGRLAQQFMRIHVESGANLHVNLEPVIPFSQSRYWQQTCIDVDRGGRLAFWDCMMAGRVGHTEEWQFHELRSETRLNIAGRTAFLDRYLLKPSEMDLRSPWVMGSATYLGTGLAFGTDSSTLTDLIHEAIPTAGVDNLDDSVSVTRVVASDGPTFHHQRQTWNRIVSGVPL